MRSPRPRTLQRVFALGLAPVVLMAVGMCYVRHARSQAVEAVARNRAVEVAARSCTGKHGYPPPLHSKLPEGQAFHVKVTREGDRRGYLVGFGWQHVANDIRDWSGRPIPHRSGSTSFDFFRVKDDGSCEYAWTEMSGPL